MKRMGYRILRRTKTLFLTFGLFLLGLYMVLNTLAEEFSAESAVSVMKHPRDVHRSLEKSKLPNEFQANFVAQGQRKPKTMNMENEDHTEDSFTYDTENKNIDDKDNYNLKYQSKSKLIQTKTVKLTQDYYKNGIEKTKVENVLKEDDIKGNTGNEEDYDPDDNYEDDDYDDEYEEKDSGDDDVDDDAYQYDDITNPPFMPGDFGDIRGFEYYRKPKLKYAEVENVKLDNEVLENIHKDRRNYTHHFDSNIENQNHEGDDEIKNDLTENGIFWSQYVETLIPRGLSYANVTRLLKQLRGQVVQTLERPSWDKCGRPLNGFAVLSDGTQMCARYRQPHSSFVYGEALSFYLSRLLQMDNVPAVILARTNVTSTMWRDVNISSLSWKEDKVVALIQWIDNINSGSSSKVHIPPVMLEAYRKGTPVTSHVIRNSNLLDRNPAHIAEVVQWGTMIVFDFLTGNYDRVASMQDAEDKENNPNIIEDSIRNLRKSSESGKLWLIDNESGLFDAYELLKPYHKNSRFTTFHNKMLQTVCVFQSSLVKSLRKLSEQPAAHKRLLSFSRSFEPLIHQLPKDNLYKKFVETFDQRLTQVMEWINHCQIIDAG